VIVDSSAIVAVLLEEPGFEALALRLRRADSPRLSTANCLEIAIVLQRKGRESMSKELDRLLEILRVEVVPVSVRQGLLARDAFARFGKGNHPARLNFGDCSAYALARETSEALLFVGEDFSQTDIAAA
jgi:ribonuclease VapC